MDTRQGLQPGAPMGNNGEILFTEAVAEKIAQSGVASMRLNFRLGARLKDWTETSSLGFSALSRYETIVRTALKYNLRILGLLSHEAWEPAAGPRAWCANSSEMAGGNGDNPYIRDFADNAAGVLIPHFAAEIAEWQIWNEPNAALTYLYPSNFAWLLRRTYAVAGQVPKRKPIIVSGGILSTHRMSSPALTSSNTGADYLRETYRQGKARAGWDDIKKTCGSYPLDMVGQNLYIDQWSHTSPARIEQAVSFVRSAYILEEGNDSTKQICISEMGWSTAKVDEHVQAANLKMAYITLKSLSYTPMTYWFFLQDEPTSYVFHGLLRPDGSEKPAWTAFREVNELHVFRHPLEDIMLAQSTGALTASR